MPQSLKMKMQTRRRRPMKETKHSSVQVHAAARSIKTETAAVVVQAAMVAVRGVVERAAAAESAAAITQGAPTPAVVVSALVPATAEVDVVVVVVAVKATVLLSKAMSRASGVRRGSSNQDDKSNSRRAIDTFECC
jgi:hypothetical protein